MAGVDAPPAVVEHPPDPGDEVAPVVEVEVGDRDRVEAPATRPACGAPARTPGPQSRSSLPDPSTRYPDCAPPGFGQAGDEPMIEILTGACWQVDRVGGDVAGRAGRSRPRPRDSTRAASPAAGSPSPQGYRGLPGSCRRGGPTGEPPRSRGRARTPRSRSPCCRRSPPSPARARRSRRSRTARSRRRRGLELEGQRPRDVAVLSRHREDADARNAARAHPAVVVEAVGQPVDVRQGMVGVDQHHVWPLHLHVAGDPKAGLGDALDDVRRPASGSRSRSSDRR